MSLFKLTNLFLIAITFVLINSCTSTRNETPVTALINYSVHSSLPHDTQAFTQGLVVHGGELFESTGQENSWIGVVNIKTGMAEKKIILDKKFFGEGITIFNNKIYQLTWQNKIGFVYNLSSFKQIKTFKYNMEGWGITHNGKDLIMSDGSPKLYFLDSANLSVIKTLDVKDQNGPVNYLNELEYVDGSVYANIWQTETIARIDAATGEVSGYLDLTLLTEEAKRKNPGIDVLNGIAWHAATQSLLVTGKYWPYIFVLKIKNEATKLNQ